MIDERKLKGHLSLIAVQEAMTVEELMMLSLKLHALKTIVLTLHPEVDELLGVSYVLGQPNNASVAHERAKRWEDLAKELQRELELLP